MFEQGRARTRSFLSRGHDARFDFEDPTSGAAGHVLCRNGRVVSAEGLVQTRHALSVSDFPDELTRLSSTHAFAFPFEIEAGPMPDDIAAGAFIAAFLGMAARGTIALVYDEFHAWRRDGATVLGSLAERLPSAWVRRLERSADGKLERAVLRGLDAFDEHTSYRSSRGGMAFVFDVLDAAGDSLPTRDELATYATMASHATQDAAEQLSQRVPRLFSALAMATIRLPHSPG